MRQIRGSIVALVTPFLSDGGIDYPALRRLLDFHVQNETDGILINGTTGESPTLSLHEFDEVTKFAVEHVGERIPVIAGTGSNHTEQAMIKAEIADYNGVDGLLVVNPYYNKPTDKGLENYYTEISKATELPIILYNAPGRTGSRMSVDFVLGLARKIENIVGIKEAANDLESIMKFLHRKPKEFSVYSGDDSLALATMLMGGDGCISVCANQIPRVFAQMMRSAAEGDIEISRNLHYKYYRLMQLNFIETNPIPVKTALHHMGMIDLHFRSPMCRMYEENEKLLIEELRHLQLIQIPSVSIISEAQHL